MIGPTNAVTSAANDFSARRTLMTGEAQLNKSHSFALLFVCTFGPTDREITSARFLFLYLISVHRNYLFLLKFTSRLLINIFLYVNIYFVEQ